MALRASELAPGQRFEAVVADDIPRTQLVMYAGASGDFHPFHHDEVFAKAAGSPRGIFAHGMLTMALAGKLLTDTFGADRLTRYQARFVAQVWPGDTLTTTVTVTQIRHEGRQPLVDVELEARNQHGEIVLSGSATARADA